MSKINSLSKFIFNISSIEDFNEKALKIFHFQYRNNKIYNHYVNALDIKIQDIKNYEQIPFIPIEFFKIDKIKTGNFKSNIIFQSSGTTGVKRSKHYVKRVDLYERSIHECFRINFGNIKDYCIIALTPPKNEIKDSSLIFMLDSFIRKSENKLSGFYLEKTDMLIDILFQNRANKKKIILFGLTYALLDLAEKLVKETIFLKDGIIIVETGGMKGKRKEILREELYEIFYRAFKIKKIHSEYGMSELLSQAYSPGNGIFRCPPWMKVRIRDVNDPFKFIASGKTGGINLLDLANLYSCSFIATQDLGRAWDNGRFEILGRFDNSDIRGCNLMIG